MGDDTITDSQRMLDEAKGLFGDALAVEDPHALLDGIMIAMKALLRLRDLLPRSSGARLDVSRTLSRLRALQGKLEPIAGAARSRRARRR